MKPSFVRLEVAFQPCLSVVTWASLKISEVCDQIRNTIQDVQVFVKEVKDMKEARVDEVFEAITKTALITLQNYPLSPNEFFESNVAFKDMIAIELEIKSAAAEKSVVNIINKFLSLVTDPNVEESKYSWLDPDKLNKPVGSLTKLTKEPYEPGRYYKIIKKIFKFLIFLFIVIMT